MNTGQIINIIFILQEKKLRFGKVNLAIASYVVDHKERVKEFMKLDFMFLQSKDYFAFGHLWIPDKYLLTD